MNSRLSCALRLALLLAIGLPLQAADPRDSGSRRDTAAHSNPTAAAKPDYVLQPSDVIRVQVFQEDDINKQGEVSVGPDHTINLPLIGTISVKGLTVRQTEEKIRALYDKDYLVNPDVTVGVLKYVEKSVDVIGAVNAAGRVSIPPERGLTLGGAIALAGGPNRYANLKTVRLTRKGADGNPVNTIIDVDAIMNKGTREDVPLQPDDSIFVPERSI
jgi:polysaccharide biosynthesis/export protein